MKDFELTAAFKTYFAGLEAFAGWQYATAQDEGPFSFPDPAKAVILIFESKSEPLAGSGSFFRSTFTVTIESHSQDTPAATHGARVELVRAALYGTASTELATKAAVIAAINAAAAVRVIGYAGEPNDASIDSQRFKTTLVLALGYATV